MYQDFNKEFSYLKSEPKKHANSLRQRCR